MVHLEVVLVTAPRPTVITIPLVTDKRLLTWKQRGLTGSRCTMRQASSQLFHSHQTTQEDGKHPRETTTRATPPHPPPCLALSHSAGQGGEPPEALRDRRQPRPE